MVRLWALTALSVVMAVLVYERKTTAPSTVLAGKGLLVEPAWLTVPAHPLTSPKDIRPADQTFLTFPEWFLVFSPAEQASYFRDHTATTFPYTTHIAQMWEGYSAVYDQIRDHFAFNLGYHVMIVVIAGSSTVEYAIKAFYETIIGRTTDTSPGEPMTEEDQFQADFLQSYVKFIEVLPWYQFDFLHQLKLLWDNTPLFGPHQLRKLERRYYLTSELLVKSGYGWLIGLATHSAYGTAALTTAVVLERPLLAPSPRSVRPMDSDDSIQRWSRATVLEKMPRYAAFVPAMEALAQEHARIIEVAGNTGAIMLSVLSRGTLPLDTTYRILFTQSIPTQPGLDRIVFVTTVNNLSRTVKTMVDRGIRIEHIYDY